MTQSEFLKVLHARGSGVYELGVALLWWVGRAEPTEGRTAKEIAEALHAIGMPQQNVSRLAGKLRDDRRTSKATTQGSWRLHPGARNALSSDYAEFAESKPPKDTGSVLSTHFVAVRGYLEKVVMQLNASYDSQLYDCCAVMCRRTIETMIIEVYEHLGCAQEIKTPDGNFLMLNGLLAFVEKDPRVSIGRNAMQGLRDFKRLGDLSAHNRRFNARKDDIDRVRDGLRVAVEELAHLAGWRPK